MGARGAQATRGLVLGWATCTGTDLAVGQVDLEPHHGLGPPDGEFEVRTEPGSGVPLLVTRMTEAAVLDVRAGRRRLVEQTSDRHLRGWRLCEHDRREHPEDGEREGCNDEDFPHYRLLNCGELRSEPHPPLQPTSPTVARHTAGSASLLPQAASKRQEKNH